MSKIINDDDNKVFIATGKRGDFKAGFVITWVSQASLNYRSPKILLIVSKYNTSLKVLEDTKALCLNLLAHGQIEEFFTFGSRSSDRFDKFSGLGHTVNDYGIELEGCAAYVHCRIDKSYETPDRKILYCTVVHERETSVPHMILSDALELLSATQKDQLLQKHKSDIQRDEEQFISYSN